MRCRKCKRKVSEYAKECPYCRERLKKDEIAVKSYVVQVEKELQGDAGGTKEKEKIRRRTIRTVMLSGIFLFFFLAGVLRQYKHRWLITEETVFYEKDHMLMAKNLDTNEVKQVAKLTFDKQPYRNMKHVQERFVFYRQQSQQLYYINEINSKLGRDFYSIYCQNVNDWSKAPKCIDENIVAHAWSKDGSLFYMKIEKDTLYRYNGYKKDKIKIKDMNAITYVEALNRLLITKENEDEDIVGIHSYDTEEKLVGRNTFYLINPETLEIEDLGVIPEGNYAFTSDYRHLYMLKDNQILDYDLENKTSSLIMNNVYDFSLINMNGKDRLYYISYTLEKKNLYSCYKDPYRVQDEKMKVSGGRSETKAERRLRQNREKFREKLKSEMIGEYSGSLYYYEEGKNIKIADQIGGFEWSDQNEKIIVYKVDKIDWTEYEIAKDVTSNAQRTLPLIKGAGYEGDEVNYFTYVQLVDYITPGKEPTIYECVKGRATNDYLVQRDKIQKYGTTGKYTYAASNSFQKYQNNEYEVIMQEDGSGNLYKEYDDQKQICILDHVIDYYVTKKGTVIVLQNSGKTNCNLYKIDDEGNKMEIDNIVDAIFAENVWSVKEKTVTIMEE